ncbi:MAG TPA: AAA family ATPase [Petrotogaceae bacterium]|nr:AAA family ATPase [Petrotogaceae bacterium]HPX14949.1 AAA family ATPase [Petrotogaceae bacterium]HQC40151.1 AAA family ATPase [Petrotogaceae bacterium]
MIVYNNNKATPKKDQPTEGEVELLNFLENNLDDSYEIYYKPWINDLHPDIMIMKKDTGVIVIEVKDWDLNDYFVKKENEKVSWYLKKDSMKVLSPFEQVKKIKDCFYEGEIKDLRSKKAKNQSFYGIVKTLVYFKNVTKDELISFGQGCLAFKNNLVCEGGDKYRNAITQDMLNASYLEKILNSLHFKLNKLFDKELYESFREKVLPPKHLISDGKKIELTTKQKELSQSKPGHYKISGIAGSGKTLTLAFRAVSACERTGEMVLILTYNCALRGYIEQMIRDVPREFEMGNFAVNNYHEFIYRKLSKAGIEIGRLEQGASKKEREEYFENKYADEAYFFPVKDKLPKYSAILIDEVQDYDSRWIAILRKFFLKENGELVLFGDEKQNLYGRAVDGAEKKPNTGIPGRWNKLKKLKRFKGIISPMIINFQKQFLSGKYLVDEVESFQTSILDFKLEYLWVDEQSTVYGELLHEIGKAENNGENVVVLGSSIEYLRVFEKFYRQKTQKATKSSFETQQEYEEIKAKLDKEKKSNMIKTLCEEIRKDRKLNFWSESRNGHELKISTIQSFKGMEMNNVILLIGENDQEELVYTGITRAREKLVILNNGNGKYHDFFAKYSILKAA